MKKVIILSGIIFFVTLNLIINVLKSPEVYENTIIVARSIEKLGNTWYVNDIVLDRSFKHGFLNPKVGDTIYLSIDIEGRVIGWKVDNSS